MTRSTVKRSIYNIDVRNNIVNVIDYSHISNNKLKHEAYKRPNCTLTRGGGVPVNFSILLGVITVYRGWDERGEGW